METLTSVHQSHKNIQSEIQFYSKETQFLLQLIAKEVKKITTPKNLILLNTYTEVFESIRNKFHFLYKEITLHEKNFVSIYTNQRENLQKNNLTEEEISQEHEVLINELQTSKESLYELLPNLYQK